MFYVELSGDITLQVYSIVKFDSVLIDDGKNFNSGDGIFIAPLSGIYMFSWTIMTYNSKQVYTELRVQNNIKARLNIVLPASERNSVTRVILCNVNKGDHVWIQTAGHTSEHFFDEFYNAKSSFMGLFIREFL